MTETMTVDEQGRTVLRMERQLAHPPAKVWRALTEPAELSGWYPFTALDIDLRVGGTIQFDPGTNPHLDEAPTGETSTMAAVITEYDPPRVFAFSEPAGDVLEWEGDNLLRFELFPEPDGCLLVLTHHFHDRPATAANAAGWTACLDALDAAIAGRPAPEPDFVGTHESFVKRFGLADGTVEDDGGGWRVRYVRQLMMREREQLWKELADPTPEVGGPPPEPFTAAGVPAGTVTAVEPARLLEYGVPSGTVRWELASHPAGARVTLTQTGRDADRDQALRAWRARLDELAGPARSHGPAGTNGAG